MNNKLVAKQTITIQAPVDIVWDALINPDLIKQYMVGTEAVSEWKLHSPIVFQGEYQGKTYQDKGEILQFQPEQILQYSHYSPLSGVPDVPENYHIVTYELSDEGEQTRLTLTQDNNETEDERTEAEKFWGLMLTTLKDLLEK